MLERALEDPLTLGVFLELGASRAWRSSRSCEPRVQRLVLAGKPVVVHMPYGGGRGDLYLASVASRVYASRPPSSWGSDCARSGATTKTRSRAFGIKMDRSSVGDFKSAYRYLTADSTPPADTAVINRMLTQRQNVVRGRGLQRPEDRARATGGHPGWPRVPGHGLGEAGRDRLRGLARGRARGAGAARPSWGKKPRTVDLRRAPQARERWATPSASR
jgi:hypothetical protein